MKTASVPTPVSALVVVILANGARLSFEHPASPGHRAWFTEAMAKARESLPSGARPVAMVVINPQGEVSHYLRGEVAELLGVQS